MLRRLSVLLPLVVLAAALALRSADPPIIERLRVLAFDRYQAFQPRPWTDANVRIVDIDDASLERLGQWPWPRSRLAELVDRLGKSGVAVVVLDMVLAEPDRTGPDNILALWGEAGRDPALAAMVRRVPDPDKLLAAAMAETPTVLGILFNHDRPPARRPRVAWGLAVAGDDPRPLLERYSGAVVNLPGLEAAAAGIGSFNSNLADGDNIIRRLPLMVRLTGGTGLEDEAYPSLAAEALRVAQGASTYIIKSSDSSAEASYGDSTGINHVRIGRAIVPTDPRGRMWLYDTGFVPERYIPAWQVLAPDFDPARVEGNIVLVGTSAAGLKDIRASALNPSLAGVELHAQALEQMILGEHLQRADWTTGAEFAWLLVFGLLIAVLLPRWGAVSCAVIALAGILMAVAASWNAFVRLGWLIDPFYPSAAILLLYLSQSFLLYLRTERERSQVRGAMGRYLSPVLVERVAKDPSVLRLGGEMRPMTVMFSDIRGFTGVAESLDAQQLTRFLNEFLTPMTDIILEHGGTIDKYMGDAIMAFWNAPLEDADHARSAARAALAMARRLPVLNAAWESEAKAQGRTYRAVAIGIGLNTGTCCVGNMGSEQRFDYSVLGDAVNLASRLEGQSKNYGVGIVAGEATRAAAPDLAWLELDLIRVKGKAKAERIFALVGDEAVAAEPWFVATESALAALLHAYRGRNWSRAAEMLAELQVASGGRFTTLCDLYADRIAACAVAPPADDWDGVYQALQK